MRKLLLPALLIASILGCDRDASAPAPVVPQVPASVRNDAEITDMLLRLLRDHQLPAVLEDGWVHVQGTPIRMGGQIQGGNETGEKKASIVQLAVDTVRPAADAKGVELCTRLSLTPGRTTGDSARLQQVAWNLLSNAIKFTPKGGRVEVSVEQGESNVRLRVDDTGQGIRADFLPHVFERFRQADSASTREHAGLGLGLAIVRHLVELHGGVVTAHSAGQDRGATFTVTLPARASVS